MSEVVFYDIELAELPERPGWVRVDRVHCWDEDAFTPDDYEAAKSLLARLPDYRPGPLPLWFGDDDDEEGGYLSAGWEPPGLQVSGVLRRTDWARWTRAFEELAPPLPCRETWE